MGPRAPTLISLHSPAADSGHLKWFQGELESDSDVGGRKNVGKSPCGKQGNNNHPADITLL